MAEPLLTRLENHIAQMAPHQKERIGAKLLIESAEEIKKFRKEVTELKMNLQRSCEITPDF